MAENFIAVQGAILIPKEPPVTAALTIVTPPDPKWNIDNKKVYKHQLTILISGAAQGTCLQTGTTTTTLDGDGDWNIDGSDLVRENKDGQTVTINGTDTVTSAPCSFSLTPKIQSAGQQTWKVKHD